MAGSPIERRVPAESGHLAAWHAFVPSLAAHWSGRLPETDLHCSFAVFSPQGIVDQGLRAPLLSFIIKLCEGLPQIKRDNGETRSGQRRSRL